MIISYVSTQFLNGALRPSVSKLQSQIADAQLELSSGRLADVGLSLGHQAGYVMSLRDSLGDLQAITDANSVVLARLGSTQTALEGIADGAKRFLGSLLATQTDGSGPQVLQAQARSALASFTSALNTSQQGTYLFGGINGETKPLTGYDQNTQPASRQAVANAFVSAFGIAQSAPGSQAISAAGMQSFLGTAFANLFAAPAWSAASDRLIESRISTNQTLATSVGANDIAFRDLASAYTMVADLGLKDLNTSAAQAVVTAAIEATQKAVQGLTNLQANAGSIQQTVTDSNAAMATQSAIATTLLDGLEKIDPYAVSTRVNALTTQLETAYSLTARIQKLSLLNYL